MSAGVRGAESVWKARYPGIRVLASKPADYDTEKARKVMTDFVQTYGDKIDGALVITNNMATAAADVAKAKLPSHPVVISSFGGQKQVSDYIRQKRIYSNLGYVPQDEGRRAVQLAIACMKGDKKPLYVRETTLAGMRSLAAQDYVINPENVDTFTPQW